MSESTCDMRQQDPFDFAWCETHDETFPLGGVCSYERMRLEGRAIAAHARGDWETERRMLDLIHLDDFARKHADE